MLNVYEHVFVYFYVMCKYNDEYESRLTLFQCSTMIRARAVSERTHDQEEIRRLTDKLYEENRVAIDKLRNAFDSIEHGDGGGGGGVNMTVTTSTATVEVTVDCWLWR